MKVNDAIELIAEYERLKMWVEESGAELMKHAIRRSKLSLRKFAEKYKYSPTYICKIRQGKFKMSIPVFQMLYMECYIPDLLDGL